MQLADSGSTMAQVQGVPVAESVANDTVLQALSWATLAFVRTRELEPVLDRLLGSVLDLLNADAGSIMLLSPSGDRLHVTAARGPRAEVIIGTSQPVDQSVAGLVLRSQRSVLLHGRALARGANRPISAHPRDLASGVGTPLRVGDRLLGVLNASRAPGAPRMNKQSLGLLELLANHAAILIDSAQSLTRELASTRKARAVLDATSEAMALVSADHQMVSVNRRFNEFFYGGLRPELVDLEFPLQQFLTDAEQIFEDPVAFRALVELTLHDPEQQLTQIVLQCAPAARELELHSTLVDDAGGVRLGRLYAFRDVTQERAADRMKSEFVALVSHELRTPLTSINGYMDLFLDSEFGSLNDDQQRAAQIVRNNGARLLQLINELLDASRLASGSVKLQVEELDLGELIRAAAATLWPLLNAKEQSLELAVPPDLAPVRGDKARLTQIMINLLSNAHKYTPAGGSIRVEVSLRDGKLQVDVQDTGIGMSAEEQAQLFTRFFRADNSTTRAHGGTGLGLVITRSLVEMHAGSMSVKSTPGEGSTFSFTLPIVQHAEPSVDRTVAGTGFDGHREDKAA